MKLFGRKKREDSPAFRRDVYKRQEYCGPFVIDCVIDKDEFVLPMLPPGGSMDDIIVKVGD